MWICLNTPVRSRRQVNQHRFDDRYVTITPGRDGLCYMKLFNSSFPFFLNKAQYPEPDILQQYMAKIAHRYSSEVHHRNN